MVRRSIGSDGVCPFFYPRPDIAILRDCQGNLRLHALIVADRRNGCISIKNATYRYDADASDIGNH